jgi:hypothetical protein
MKRTLICLAGGAVLAILGLIIIGSGGGNPSMTELETYNAALTEIQERIGDGPPAGSPEEQAAIDRFKALFADLSVENVESSLESVYAEELFFNDTVKTLRTLPELKTYMLHTAEGVEACRVKVVDVIRSGGDFFFRWEMEIVFKKLKPGLSDTTIGMTHVRFDDEGRVVLHQDYWDSARGIYEHVPFVGKAIRAIKARL